MLFQSQMSKVRSQREAGFYSAVWYKGPPRQKPNLTATAGSKRCLSASISFSVPGLIAFLCLASNADKSHSTALSLKGAYLLSSCAPRFSPRDNT